MKKYLFSFGIVSILSVSILFPAKTLASWAYSFVVWDGYVYVITNETVNEVDEEIGHVTKYSDREGTYSGNFSNVFPKGTKYYSIVGVSTDEAISVEDGNGAYIKANRSGEYAGNKNDRWTVSSTIIIVWILIFVIIAMMGIYYINKRRG
ncbi:hypothetical protein MHB48_18815 [Psychrobacillus sp. FSL H8-0483]|uniref:hypothetical protein n=1 Tax=Psychrobacillus sp. FSL H8-0483 TaxID=2921389 RepID=UPI003159CFF3